MVNEYKELLKYGAIVVLTPFSAQHRIQQWQQIYTVILLIVHVSVALDGIINLPINENLIVSNFVGVLLYSSQSSILALIVVEVMFKYSCYFRYMTQTQRVKELFHRHCGILVCWHTVNDHRWLRKKLIIYFIIFYVGIGMSMFAFAKYYHFYYGYFWYTLPTVIFVRTRWLQMIFYMEYIIYYKEMLNLKLYSLVSCKVQQHRLFLDVNYTRLESLEYLINLKEIHMSIYRLSRIFNQMFGWSILFVCTGIFFDIIVNFYWTSLTLTSTYQFNYIFWNASKLIPLLTMLLMLCYIGELCKRQYCRSAALVQKLQTISHSNVNGNHEKVYNELVAEFSLQIMQNPIKIHAKGFFAVDLSSLMETFTATVTYLIILIQFRGEEN